MLRAQAVRGLGVLGDPKSARVIRTLVSDDSHEFVLEAAIRALGMLGDSASIPTLRALVRDRQDLRFQQTRTRRFEPAVKSLVQLRDPELLALLRTYARGGVDSRTVQWAIESLTRFDDLRAVPVLRELMASSESPMTRVAAIGATGSPRARPPLRNAAYSGSPPCAHERALSPRSGNPHTYSPTFKVEC